MTVRQGFSDHGNEGMADGKQCLLRGFARVYSKRFVDLMKMENVTMPGDDGNSQGPGAGDFLYRPVWSLKELGPPAGERLPVGPATYYSYHSIPCRSRELGTVMTPPIGQDVPTLPQSTLLSFTFISSLRLKLPTC